MTTARDIIKSSLRKIHVLGTGASLDATEADDALSTLNSLLGTWSVEGNLVFTESSESFPLVGGTGSYTIGAGGDFDTARPVKITSAFVRIGSIDYPLSEIDRDEYAQISYKSAQSIPCYFYYDAGFPLGTIKIQDIPTTGSIFINSDKYLTEFSTLDSAYSMPPEYRAALENNLAVWLASEYEREPSRTLNSLAHKTKAAVETQNRRNNIPRSTIDVPSSENDRRGNYNVNRGF